MARESVGLGDSVQDIIFKMSEGNPGAITVLAQVLKKSDSGIFQILSLDDMNIRGPQIWVAYKDHCGEDLDKFIAAIENRDQAMVDTINRCCGGEELAVCSGASYKR